MTTTSRLTPLLLVRGATRASDFYTHALAAQELARFEHGPNRRLGHADVALGTTTVSQTEELRARSSDAPGPLVGSLRTPARAAVAEDTATVCDSGVPPQAKSAEGVRVHLVVGPVGAGKSTFARQLAREQRAVRFALDEWMAELFAPDRPEIGRREWYVERRSRCQAQIWATAKAVAAAQTDAVLELGLLRRDERERFYRLIDEAELRLIVHVLDAPRDVRRERVKRRNETQGETFSMVVPLDFFELASDLWQPLEPAECDGRDVRFLFTHG